MLTPGLQTCGYFELYRNLESGCGHPKRCSENPGHHASKFLDKIMIERQFQWRLPCVVRHAQGMETSSIREQSGVELSQNQRERLPSHHLNDTQMEKVSGHAYKNGFQELNTWRGVFFRHYHPVGKEDLDVSERFAIYEHARVDKGRK